MKKNLLSLLIVTGLAGSIFVAPTVFAAGDAATQTAQTTTTQAQLRDGAGQNTTSPEFLDEDKDGICDNFTEGTFQMMRAGSGRPDGVPGGLGQKNGLGEDFIDADKDGVCDNLGTAVRKLDGSGRPDGVPGGLGQKNGLGENFEDADKDGVCDNVSEKTPLLKKDGTGNPNRTSSPGKNAGKGTGKGK